MAAIDPGTGRGEEASQQSPRLPAVCHAGRQNTYFGGRARRGSAAAGRPADEQRARGARVPAAALLPLETRRLHSAIVHGGAGEVRSALRHGADVEAAEFGGLTPLHKAAFRGDVEVCRALLGQAANVNSRDSTGQSPLHAAALQLHPGVLQLLLRRGAEADAVDHEGLTPARAAAARCHQRAGDVERVAMCLEHLTRAYELGCQACGSPSPVLEANAHQLQEPYFSHFALTEAAAGSKQRPAASLGGSWCSIDQSWKSVSTAATSSAWEESTLPPAMPPSELVSQRSTGAGASDMWTMSSEKPIVLPSLQKAAFRGDLEQVRTLLRQHADVCEVDRAGETALHAAAVASQPAVISLLLRQGASVWATNQEGVTPVRCAVNRLHSIDDSMDLRRLAFSIDLLLSAQERELRDPRRQAAGAPRCGVVPRCSRAGVPAQGAPGSHPLTA
uniref:Uncharacterized protein n=1 Tax=Alexandrium monilatum TaxID=311494 RepID=A0A7S4SKI3_9DINO